MKKMDPIEEFVLRVNRALTPRINAIAVRNVLESPTEDVFQDQSK